MNMCDRGNNTFLNLDIWSEIIQYYRDLPDVRFKNQTLKSLALVSRRLTPLAQSEIWRTVDSIRHVVNYINDAEGSNIIRNTNPKLLRRPIQGKTMERVQDILSSTRHFIFGHFLDFYDFELVQMVIGRLHLFDNLKTIFIDWSGVSFTSNNLSILLSLASPGIESVTHQYLGKEMAESTFLAFHGLLRMYHAPIKSLKIDYSSYVPPRVIQWLLHGAPIVSLHINEPRLSSDDRFTALCLSLSACSDLTSLVIRSFDRLVPFWDPPLSAGNNYCLAKLRQLKLKGGTWRDPILERLECPSLTTLAVTLSVDFQDQDERPIFLSAGPFMQLERISIHFTERHPLSFKDLQPLLHSPALRQLKITHVISYLTENNVKAILSTKPSLQKLIIYGPQSEPLSSSFLSTILQHQLHTFCLPISLNEVTALKAIQDNSARNHSLMYFFISQGSVLPKSTRARLTLAEFIYHMFPNAKIADLGFYRNRLEQSVKDLEVIRAYISQMFEARA